MCVWGGGGGGGGGERETEKQGRNHSLTSFNMRGSCNNTQNYVVHDI